MFDGPATSFDSYDFFGDPILSATAGKVVRVVNDLPETPAGTFPQGITAAQRAATTSWSRWARGASPSTPTCSRGACG